ncbi:MAG: hypothetical protein P1V51_13210 [Deltaproteobacteria bacterium]|nr:hypothetical protein [Deltaproteobacteria bacterium]
MHLHPPLFLALLGLAACAATPRPDARAPEIPPMTFEDQVAKLVQALEAAAPPGVRVQVDESTPETLGWEAAEGTPARILALWAPSGVNRHLGLLPGGESYAPLAAMRAQAPHERGGPPRQIASGPGLLVVDAPSPMVALTLEVERRDGPLLQRTLDAAFAQSGVEPSD